MKSDKFDFLENAAKKEMFLKYLMLDVYDSNSCTFTDVMEILDIAEIKYDEAILEGILGEISEFALPALSDLV